MIGNGASAEVLLRRIGTRTTNDYGKSGEERDLVLRHLAEPLLRATCTHEVPPEWRQVRTRQTARLLRMTHEVIYAQGRRAQFGGRSRRNSSTVAYACLQSE